MERNVTEKVTNAFERASFSSGNTIRGVCIMGTRESKNGYTYSEAAQKDIAKRSQKLNVYLNHPSQTEAKERDGVRDLRDWIGVVENGRLEGQKVMADFRVRESFKGLISDISDMGSGVGFSINARVMMSKDNSTVESVPILKSADLVASPAMTKSLYESAHNETDPITIEVRRLEESIERKRREGGYLERR